MEQKTKQCTQCKRELPANKDFYFMKLGKLNNRCKECCGRHFTNHLTHIPKEGYVFCKKCDRELPHTPYNISQKTNRVELGLDMYAENVILVMEDF